MPVYKITVADYQSVIKNFKGFGILGWDGQGFQRSGRAASRAEMAALRDFTWP